MSYPPLSASGSSATYGTCDVSACLNSRLTIVGGGRETWVVMRRGREKTVCARGASLALLGGPSTSPLEPQCALTGRPFILPPWLLWRLASAAGVRVSFFGSPMCQVSNAGGNWF